MKRRDEPEEEGSSYSWMDTYGDMVTLLLCFFVLLYSFSSFDAAKWQKIVQAFTGSSGSTEVAAFDESTIRDDPIGDIDEMINEDDEEQEKKVEAGFSDLYGVILSYINDNKMADQVSVSKTEDTIVIRFNEMALFRSGEAVILQESIYTMNKITELISDYLYAVKMVRVEGHTDNVPINTSEFYDNWDLSVKRATNTLRLILETGLIDESKISAIGYGENQPIADNDTEEGRSKNRRVDIVIQKIITE